MQPFPTQYSTLAAPALRQRIEEQYAFTGLSCRFLLRGVSDTYVLEDNQPRYILKIYRDAHRTLTEIKSEVELLNKLKAGGAKVAAPIADRHGHYIQHFNAAEGTRHGVLTSFAPGRVITDLNPEQLDIIGHEMALNHTIGSTIQLENERKPYNIQTTLIQPLQVMKKGFGALTEEYAWLSQTADKVMRKMETFHTAAFTQGYCHYDYLPKNFHFDEQNNVTFFDFDFAGKGALVNDLMTFRIHFFFHTHAGNISEETAQAHFDRFVSAYRQAHPLSEEELAAIPYFGFMFWVFYFGFYFEHFEDWSNTFLGPHFIRNRTSLIREWTDKYCRF